MPQSACEGCSASAPCLHVGCTWPAPVRGAFTLTAMLCSFAMWATSCQAVPPGCTRASCPHCTALAGPGLVPQSAVCSSEVVKNVHASRPRHCAPVRASGGKWGSLLCRWGTAAHPRGVKDHLLFSCIGVGLRLSSTGRDRTDVVNQQNNPKSILISQLISKRLRKPCGPPKLWGL